MLAQEKLERLKPLIEQIADCDVLEEKQVRDIVELCEVDWEAEDLQMICYEYWEPPFSLDEIAYFLIHGEHQKANL